MAGLRFATIMVVGLAVSTTAPGEGFAQVYGGVYRGLGHQHTGYYAGGYIPGGYSVGGFYGSPYSGFGSSYSSYSSGYYGIGTLGTGSSYGMGSYGGIGYQPVAPVIVGPSPVYGSTTTIIRGGPTGGVIQYSNDGNGYTYSPDSSYPTVIQQQPTLGLSRTIVQPSPRPVVIESRPLNSYSPPLSNSATPSGSAQMIKLACPKAAPGPLTYSLNGHVYTIQPGYSQTFPDDRPWTVEFRRGSEGSEVVSYAIKAGTYMFVVGPSGWDLQQPTAVISNDALPPAPLPEAPGPTPMPPQ